VDIVADLNQPFELLPDGCCTHLTAFHVLEHIVELLPLMAEIHRILRADGVFEVVVPHFATPFAYSDPTHVRFFGAYSMHYFADEADQPGIRRIPSFYTPTRFRIEDIRVRFEVGGKIDGVLGRLMNYLVNRNFQSMAQWERRMAWLIKPAEIQYRLRPKKQTPTGQVTGS
jgi:SAM-dependent methyltransferase